MRKSAYPINTILDDLTGGQEPLCGLNLDFDRRKHRSDVSVLPEAIPQSVRFRLMLALSASHVGEGSRRWVVGRPSRRTSGSISRKSRCDFGYGSAEGALRRSEEVDKRW